MMKKFNQFIWIICLVFIVSCNSGTKKSNSNQADKPVKVETEVNKSHLISRNDSLISKRKPTYQQLYSESEQRFEIIGNLKHNPSTGKKIYNYNLGRDSIKITLYHLNERIVTIEKRIYNNNNELGFRIFDFNEKNDCFSSSQWNSSEKMTYTNAMYWDTFISFDVHCNIIDMDFSEKKQIIQSTRASLDSIMQHFPEFRYSFNWE
ncbi:MAG: hypothetical protein C0397_19615 [Odoribacter sp.]|nr:hypothetical protein [Odoribacter sp.]